jgi:hypothetical protein
MIRFETKVEVPVLSLPKDQTPQVKTLTFDV